MEIGGGIRKDIIAGLTWGWSARVRMLDQKAAPIKEMMWYTRGFGTVGGAKFNFTYSIGYTFFTARKHLNKPQPQL